LPTKKSQRQELEGKLSVPGFWDNRETAQATVSQISALKAVIEPAEEVLLEISDTAELFEMAAAESDAETLKHIEQQLPELQSQIAQIELQGLLSGLNDARNCFFGIHAGAGGTESCDWANMLLRMYTRYFEKKKFKFEELEITPGEEAGIRSIMLRVAGPFAFGRLSCEIGVHRLVRISPFDSQSRRHTSFAAVECVPEFEEDIDIAIDEEDLRIDFYRAGGPGGQNVNKVSSAVRILHKPTGIVAQCQNERSQHKNKAQAMKVLKGRLYMLEQQKRDTELAKLVGEKGLIAWGNQIRSYVLQPYQMVKDHRTDFQTSQTADVLNGDLDDFIESYLRYKAKSKQTKG